MTYQIIDQEEKTNTSTANTDTLNVPLFVALLLFTVGDNFFLALYDGIYDVPDFLSARWVEAFCAGSVLIASAIALDFIRKDKVFIITGCGLFIISGIAALSTESLNGAPLFFIEKIARGFVYFGLLKVLLQDTPFMGFVQKTVLLSFIGANCLTYLLSTFMFMGSSDDRDVIITLYGVAFFVAIIILVAVANIRESKMPNLRLWFSNHPGYIYKSILPFLLICFTLNWAQQHAFQYVHATYSLGVDQYALRFFTIVVGFGLVALLHFVIQLKNPWYYALIALVYTIVISGISVLVDPQSNMALHVLVHAFCYATYYISLYTIFKLMMRNSHFPLFAGIAALMVFANHVSYIIPEISLNIKDVFTYTNF